ncbi:DmX-like protein 2 [Hypsibius exemplaris]|uniref:DmX-like protein 2 n=1 Tax=Hypsibius exemplaris TaxID=2072580 RepID=A0A9X6RKZ8_HYPEX|nr:DmX-like protein 2 [Hypsibius exemplaris]
MNRHQVITGAVNCGDHCYSVGTVEGVNFTAYGTGCDIVVLSSDFQRVQIIPGHGGGVQVTCIDCSKDTGKIAACYGTKVHIYEPTPLFHRTSAHRLDYQWMETGVLHCDSIVTALTWNQEGTRLLTAGHVIQLWSAPLIPESAQPQQPPTSGQINGHMVNFSLGENDQDNMDHDGLERWKELWSMKTSSPVAHIDFSPDGCLFATVAKGDRLVKVWYPHRNFIFASQQGQDFAHGETEQNYSFVYLPHPRAVTSFSWRKTSRYMPKGAVANMLLTSCMDNISRLWVETILPDDGLLNIQHLDPLVSQNAKYRQHQHKHGFVERLKHMRKSFKKARTQRDRETHQQPHSNGINSGVRKDPVATLPTSDSAHNFMHKFGVHGTGVSPECHFHLAVSINADTDIPLVPLLSSGSGEPLSFVIHWLNNKEMNFTWQAEKLLHDLCKKALQTDRPEEGNDIQNGSPDPLEEDEEEYDERRSEEKEAVTPNGQPPPSIAASAASAKQKKKGNTFGTLRKKIRIPHIRSTELFDDETVSVTSSANRSQYLQQNSVASVAGSVVGSGMIADQNGSAPGDTLDREIENLVRYWHKNADLLFSIHPLDGSFLVWLVEWLDEEQPGSFRQPQVSFASRIPQALPLGDSVTTCSNLEVYSTHSSYLDLYSMLKLSDDRTALYQETNVEPPVVSMISCHQNGSLNLWRINFSDAAEFSTVVSLGHIGRVCGHRFRVNDMVSHPVLPLLLTTSHHNTSGDGEKLPVTPTSKRKMSQAVINFNLGKGFCSEMILWKVDPVGPLSKSGGITELARINSGELSAFSNCAWVPTMLPCWTLGNLSQTPSACFVASDGVSLRIYQAVIDAQMLLAEMYCNLRKPSIPHSESTVSTASSIGGRSDTGANLDDFNIVSLQSSAHPGCILALDHITDARNDWHNTQFLHIFNEHILRGRPSAVDLPQRGGVTQLEAVVDLTSLTVFEENFYLTVIEKGSKGGSLIHMWSISISSKQNQDNVDNISRTSGGGLSGGEDDDLENFENGLLEGQKTPGSKLSPSNLRINTAKVCCQPLPLPDGIEVVHATPAAGHLSSSAIYPACYAPYLIATSCSDGTVRFWRCHIEEGVTVKTKSYFWEEWKMMLGHSSCLTVPGRILGLSCAYSARVACAYKASVDHIRQEREDSPQYTMTVAIFECESTGGSEWVQEDKIAVRGVHFAQTASPLPDTEESFLAFRREKKSVENLSRFLSGHENFLPSVSSVSNFRRVCTDNPGGRKARQSVTLDWVSTEDGSHVLTIGLGPQIMVFAAVSNDIAQENMKALALETTTTKRPLLRQASSFAAPVNKGVYRWMRLRMIMLDSQDGAPMIPNQLTWVRTGLLVLGMDNEMYVYSQWKKTTEDLIEGAVATAAAMDARDLSDYNLVRMGASPSRMKVTRTMPSLMSSDQLKKLKNKKTLAQISQTGKNVPEKDIIVDRGLFEAARIASPVLPQYHPKQLTELLNFGRLRRVQAILAHLLRCIRSAVPTNNTDPYGDNMEDGERSSLSRQLSLQNNRRKSIVGLSPTNAREQPLGQQNTTDEFQPLDYIEIDSIPPLPLFALLEADNYTGKRGDAEENYDALFSTTNDETDQSLDDLLDADDEEEQAKKRRKARHEPVDMYAFVPHDATHLVHYLTHMHLPGLSSLDQMHLLALADTVANCSGKLTIEQDQEEGAQDSRATAENVDPCGLRYLLAVRQHVYLMRCVPHHQRAKLQKQGIETSYIAWAFHSENQQELLAAVSHIVPGDLKWSDFKELGVGWWLKSNALLKTVVEKMAKNAFQASQNPLDAALFYLALKRKKVLAALFKLVADQRMIDFFSNDFKEDRWRKAALKNAFALLGKQRFEHAAAFFLLGGAVKDAVDIIMTKLNDVQLALTVVRLYEGDEFGTVSENQTRVLQDYVIDSIHDDIQGSDDHSLLASQDPFQKSMAHWLLRDYNAALQTLLEDDRELGSAAKPSIFNFYDYLRNHPIVVRQVQASTKAQKKDCISSVERRLFFKTAHVYFRAGCPQLALEVLCKLPEFFYDDVPDLSVAVKGVNGLESVGTPVRAPPLLEVEAVDWSAPVLTVKEDKFEIKWDDEEEEDCSETGSVKEFGLPEKKSAPASRRSSVLSSTVQDLSKRTDIMAQQLKFIAGLKILMEELSTLATGIETDGGQLRFILYMWLEKEVEILKLLCYKSGTALSRKLQQVKAMNEEVDERVMSYQEEKPSLHEVMLADKMDFDARLQRVTRRKTWLKANQQLLRSLIHYCQIYGGNGGGLASVYMELTLLAHELYQGSVQQQQQLLTPLPFLTTLPLLSAFLTGPMTISSDPVNFVSNMSQDLLRTVAERRGPPSHGEPIGPIYILRDIALALSACVYQSLCDSDSSQVRNVQQNPSAVLEGFAATLLNSGGYIFTMQQRKRRMTSTTDHRLIPTTQPSKWPGVQSLRALLARERDENAPRLYVLLMEAFIAVYMSLLTTGLALRDVNLLYRLVGINFNVKTWSNVFGGGAKKVVRTASVERKRSDASSISQPNSEAAKHRNLLNAKVLGHAPGKSPSTPGTKVSTPVTFAPDPQMGANMFQEVFVPPESSIVSCVLNKPLVDTFADPPFADYDSNDSQSDDEEPDHVSDSEMDDAVTRRFDNEHLDPNSYSWAILRLVIVKAATRVVQQVLTTVSVDQQDLPVISPALHLTMRVLEKWQNSAVHSLDDFGAAPEHYIPRTYSGEAPQSKKSPYAVLLDPDNTPFQTDKPSALPIKRLWTYLIHQDYLQETFVKFMFKRRRADLPSLDTIAELTAAEDTPKMARDAIRIVHKDQDIVTAFAVNRANPRMIVLSTARDITEINISSLLHPEEWLQDEGEFGLLTMKNQAAVEKADPEFLVLQTPSDQPPTDNVSRSAASSQMLSHYQVSSRGAYVTFKRPCKEVRRLCPHPMLPYYVSGSADGIIRLWEFGHPKELTAVKASANMAKINHLEFSSQGNKFAAGDADGLVSFWQLGTCSNNAAPYFSLQCHNKTCSAFTFLGSSSVIATAGHASESRNVAIWDTLLPPKKSMVASFVCHDTGSSALVYAAQHNLLITCGKKGDVCLFDIRQRQLRHKFQAHDSAIRAIALDPTEEYFVTGSAEGDVKVWGLSIHNLLLSLPEEHKKQTFFRNSSNGVMQLDVDSNNRLFSCGADGFFKIRSLQPADYVVQTL